MNLSPYSLCVIHEPSLLGFIIFLGVFVTNMERLFDLAIDFNLSLTNRLANEKDPLYGIT